MTVKVVCSYQELCWSALGTQMHTRASLLPVACAYSASNPWLSPV